jgi:hypothetical protein
LQSPPSLQSLATSRPQQTLVLKLLHAPSLLLESLLLLLLLLSRSPSVWAR